MLTKMKEEEGKLANIFDKVVAGLNKGVNTVSEGSKLIVEKANINTKIGEFEKEKKRMLQNMGTLVYNLHINGEAEIEQCVEMYAEIENVDRNIASLQNQLHNLETQKNQPVMQTVVPNEQVADGVTCECGFVNKNGAKFCAKCGKNLTV